MPILGPNCYGLLNYLDNVTLWPDQHGGVAVDSGVAIVAQSSNIAINMTMQARGLPIAYVVAAGNQAQTGASAIAEALLEDDRVTAIGLYLEGFGDIRALEAFAAKARAKRQACGRHQDRPLRQGPRGDHDPHRLAGGKCCSGLGPCSSASASSRSRQSRCFSRP